MGAYNRLKAQMQCPRCQQGTEMEIDCYFGYVAEMREVSLGEIYPWVERKAVQNGGRPEGGTLDGEGYTECPLCGKDFFVIVRVRGDVLASVEPDLSKPPYIPD